MHNEVSMNLHHGYDAKDFSKDAVSNWSSAEPEFLEWTEEIHNSMFILAERDRKQSIYAIEVFDFIETVLNCTDAISEIKNVIATSFIEFNELPELGFPEASFPLVKEVLKKFSVV